MSSSKMCSLTSRKLRVGIWACLALLAAGLFFSVRAVHDEGPPIGGGPNGQPNSQPLLAMGKTSCVGGMAGTFPCHNVDLASFLPLSDIGGGSVNDVWGWTDPLTGKEYAIVGRSNATSFVDISNPEQPTYLGNLPPHSVDSVWRSIKVYADHAFIVSEADNHGLHVVDIRNPGAPVFAGCVGQDGYTHETQCVIYRGPGLEYQGHEVCFNSNEDTLTIVD